MKKRYGCGEVSIDHPTLIRMRKEGTLQLGIDNALATHIANTPGAGPKRNTSSLAFHLYSWIAVGVFGYSIYLSFTSAWWWFIPGFFLMGIIWRANKSGNAENLLDAAMNDPEFYQRVREAGGWLYELEEADAEALKASS